MDRTEIQEQILKALEELHNARWEEMRAPVGHHTIRAQKNRESKEATLRRVLGTYNPRDQKIYRRTAK